MIYWRIKIYDLGTHTIDENSLDLSELSFIGDGFFSLFTRYNMNEISFSQTNLPILWSDIAPIYERTLSDDYYTLYGSSLLINKSDIGTIDTVIHNLFPSFGVHCPNLIPYLSNNIIGNYTSSTLIVIPTLSKAFAANNGSSNSHSLYDVDDSICTRVGTYSFGSYPAMSINSYAGIRFQWLGVQNYRKGIDLSTADYIGLDCRYIPTGQSTSLFYDFSKNNVFKQFISNFFSSSSVPDGEDVPGPFDPIPPSDEGGGNGTFDDDSDLIPDSSLPTLSSANTGFTRIYNPTLSQVQDLASYLWTDETLIETLWNKIKQYFEDPMQAIIGFNLVPVPVPDAGSKNFALMYIDTGVSMNVAASQFVDRDCGILTLEPYYGSALDYSPYTKVSAFLPYIGNVQLDVDEVMGRTLQVKYRVDICSGSCVAKILVDGNVLYQYSGHCAIHIPFAASDFSSYVQAAISVAKLGVAAAVAAAGGPPPVGAMDPSQQTNQVVTTTQTTETARNPMTGRQITTGTRTTIETREAPASQGSTQASFSALSPANVSNTVGQIMSSKPVVNHSGSFSGNTGYLGVRRPYLIIERPNLCMPQNFQTMNGYPSMITMELSTCKGYTRVQQVQLTGLTATNPEQAEIQELLKSGVIF